MNVLRLVKMTVGNAPCWHYVLINKVKLPLLRSGQVADIAKSGEIIASGWGRMPPLAIQQEIEARYS